MMQYLNQMNTSYTKNITTRKYEARKKPFKRTFRLKHKSITLTELIMAAGKAIKCFICSIISCESKKASDKFSDQKLSFTSSDNLMFRIDR